MADSAIRQLTLLTLIPRSPGRLTTGELHKKISEAGFDITPKTTERDLNALSRYFPILSDESSKPYHWYFDPLDIIDIPGLTPQMALTLNVLRKHSQSLLPKNVVDYLEPYFKQADKELKSLSNNILSSWNRKVHVVHDNLSFEPPKYNEEIVNCLYLSVIKGKQIKAQYHARGKDKKEYQLNPLSLVFKGQLTYLLCTSGQHDTILHFLINRFIAVEVSEDNIPEHCNDIDIEAYLAKGSFGMLNSDKKLELTARIKNIKGRHLFETPLSSDQEIIQDRENTFLLKASVADSRHLLWWLMSMGDDVEVIEPISIRDELISNASRVLEIYNK